MKTTENDGKIPDIANLVTKAAINTIATEFENKIPDASSFITTPESDRLAEANFDAIMKEAAKSLVSKKSSRYKTLYI